MKKIKSILMIGVAALAAMTSCDSPTYPGGGDNSDTDNGKEEVHGQVSFAQMSIKLNLADISIGSRANVEDLSKYTINIKRVDTSGALRSVSDGNQSFLYGDMPELVALPVGEYVVEAYNAEEQVAEFDAPYIYGRSNQFSVIANDIVTVDPIECKLGNIKVSIAYSDELRAHMSDVKVTVTVADNETLVFTGDETRSGYFKYVEGNTTIAATFEGKVDGFDVTDYKVLTNAVAPGNHHTITFSLKDAPNPPDEYGSIGNSGFSLDATVTRVNVNGDATINGGEEEIIEPDAPKEYLTVGTDALSFGCDAEQKTVQVKASHDWTVESSATWCTVTKTASGISVDVAANSDANNDRTATITITMNKLTTTIAVTQAKYTEAPQGPVITSDYIDLEGTNLYSDFNESRPASINVDAPNGIKTFIVDISSTNEGFASAISDMELTHFDLCNPEPGNQEYNINGLHLPNGDQVKNQTSIVFDITQFMELLPTFHGTHSFKITVTDNANASSEVTIRIES